MKLLDFKVQAGVLAAVLACQVVASTGDRLPEFRDCVSACTETNCIQNQNPLPLGLRLLFWDCRQDCDYKCQRAVTARHVEQNQQIHQFHGKWPFVRMLGIQEPASVIFSLLNFLPHYEGLKRILLRVHDDNNTRLRKWYALFAVVGMNAWLWSAVFHTRDFVLTERLDYFSAMLTIVYGLFVACLRIFRLDMPQKSAQRYVLGGACILFYLCHVGYLSLVTFSYSYNMAAGVVVGLIHNILWGTYSVMRYNSLKEAQPAGNHAWALVPLWIVLAIMAGMSLELFDFSPFWFVFDAHALWHLATVVPTHWWYTWMERDVQSLAREKAKE